MTSEGSQYPRRAVSGAGFMVLGATLNFIIIAMVVFLVLVKLLGALMKKKEEAPGPVTTKTCPVWRAAS